MTPSPNLADASNGSTGSGAERRRVPRLNLTTEQFRLAATGKIFSVSDLSTEGMALRVLDSSDLAVFPIAARVEGTLNLRGEKFAVRAKVAHIGRDLVGFQFDELAAETQQALDRFLDPAALGQELRPIPSGEGGALWYHGPTGTDLLLWRRADGQYRKISLFVLGSYAQWDETAGLSTGRVSSSYEDADVRGVMRFETMLLDADSAPDVGKLKVAKTLVLSSNLPQDLKKWCVRQFGGNDGS